MVHRILVSPHCISSLLYVLFSMPRHPRNDLYFLFFTFFSDVFSFYFFILLPPETEERELLFFKPGSFLSLASFGFFFSSCFFERKRFRPSWRAKQRKICIPRVRNEIGWVFFFYVFIFSHRKTKGCLTQATGFFSVQEKGTGKTGLEPATFGVTNQHSNHLSYFPFLDESRTSGEGGEKKDDLSGKV